MKKAIQSSIQQNIKIGRIIPALIFLLSVGFSKPTYSQCSLTCNNNVQISVDANCYAQILPDDMLEGNWDVSCEPITVIINETGTDYVTSNEVGETLTVTVTAAGGNSCTGTIVVSDYIAPVINCQPTTITCFDDPASVPDPEATDNCGFVSSLTYTESTQDIGCNGSNYQIITRTYTAIDDSGNSSTCDLIINVSRPSLNNVVPPPNYDDIDEPALDCVNPNTSTSNTGSPTIDGHPINTSCDFAADFEDQILSICQNSYKILRDWTVYDWCNSTNVTFTQVIKVVDKTGPNITCPADVTISVANDDCFANMIIPNPNVSDDCSSSNNIGLEYSASSGTVNNNTLYNLPPGVHTITYTATDDCDNTSTCSMFVTVVDDIPPVAVCETNHVVGINSTGASLVQAQTFDDGSYDNCSSITFEARRMDTPHCPGNDGTGFDAFVPFYCCDIGNTVMVELRVTDAEGNTNSCMVEATAQDEVNPIISCPPNIDVDCGADYNDLSLTGEPTASDNCNVTLSYVDNENTNNCGGGTINRIWTATDDSGNTSSCLQIISLVNSTPFYITDTNCNNSNPNDGVIWPCDYDTDACGPGLDPSVTGEPEIFEDFCDLVAVTYEDEIFPITPPACLKIFRTWIVVDWCTYDEDTGEGVWEYIQIIKVLNSDYPEIQSSCDDLSFCSYDEDCMDGPATLTLEATDDCTDTEDLNYYYWIDLNNDGSNDIESEGNDASGTYPLGTHNILWHVEDGCGNISVCEYTFVIADCKKPTPYVYNGLALDLSAPDGVVELWATDFDNGSFDNCGIEEFLIISPSQGPGQTTPPQAAAPSWVFDCDDLGTATVDFWVLDVNGNWDYVSTYVLIQDNLEMCGVSENFIISGTIETEIEEPIANVAVHMDGFPGPDQVDTTDEFGLYILDATIGGNYVVTPVKDINPLNGVTTFDMVLISQHILDIQSLDSPYKMIAADVNNSGYISTIDLVQLRKLILYTDTTFYNNTSWRFVDASFIFPNPNDPWTTSFPEVYSINGLTGNTNADFVGIKTGDVNNSANTSDLHDESESRSDVPYIFEALNKKLKKGETYSIPLFANNLNTLLGFQFSLELDQDVAEVLNIEYGSIPEFSSQNIGQNLKDQGLITISWHTPTVHTSLERTKLMTVTIKAKEDAELIDIMRLNETLLNSEVYDLNLDIKDLALAFKEEAISSTLFQNQPNPFYNQTKIGFDLSETGSATFSIIDISGKVIYNVQDYYNSGYNEIIIDKTQLQGPGLYFYQLQPEFGEKSIKKLVLTDRPKE